MVIVNDIKPRGTDSAYVNAPFDKAKVELENSGYEIISLEENARLRIQEGKDSYVSRNGNYVREDFLYVLGKDKFIFTKNSPIMAHPQEATQAHREGKEFYVSDDDVQKALENSVEISYTQESIPTNRFGEDEITVFAFGDEAQKYGDFLKNAGINEMPFWIVDKDYIAKQNSPFARKLWFGGLGNRSVLNGDNRYLRYGDRLRGVREVAPATEPRENFSKNDSYNSKQISSALKSLKLQGLEEQLIETLKK